MPLYEYKCPDCATRVPSFERGDRLDQACPSCGRVPLKRVWSLGFQMPMHEHFNQSVGKPISSMRQYSDELKRKSDEATALTGIEHRYVPVDMNDRKTLGIDGRGIDESNRAREKAGEPLLPDVS